MKKTLITLFTAACLAVQSANGSCYTNTTMIPYVGTPNVISITFADSCPEAPYYVLEVAYSARRVKVANYANLDWSQHYEIPRMDSGLLGMVNGVGYWEIPGTVKGYYYFRIVPAGSSFAGTRVWELQLTSTTNTKRH